MSRRARNRAAAMQAKHYIASPEPEHEVDDFAYVDTSHLEPAEAAFASFDDHRPTQKEQQPCQ